MPTQKTEQQIPLKRTPATPLYRQLDAIMRSKVQSGEWKANEIIPPENELAKLCDLSCITARMVVAQWAREGLLYRVHGKGTFIAEKKITAHSLSYTGKRGLFAALMNAAVSVLHLLPGTEPILRARTEQIQWSPGEGHWAHKNQKCSKHCFGPKEPSFRYAPFRLLQNVPQKQKPEWSEAK